jgi:hypothetical protein
VGPTRRGVCAMPKQPKRRGPIRADDIPVPTRVSNEDFVEICCVYRIPASLHQSMRMDLNELVDRFGDWMTNERSQPHRRADRVRLKDARASIKSGINQLQKLCPPGRLALKAMSRPLAPMLSAQWISHNFPDDDYAPTRSAMPPQNEGSRSAPLRPPLRVWPVIDV